MTTKADGTFIVENTNKILFSFLHSKLKVDREREREKKKQNVFRLITLFSSGFRL